MKRVLKVFGITILVFILLLIALPFLFKGEIVEKIKEEANKNLNAKVDFGDFGMSLITSFPNFTFSIENVKVEGIDQFEGITLADIKSLDLAVDLMSVISGDEIKVKRISIDNPTIYALVLADSSANWDIAKASDEEEVTEEDTTSSSFALSLDDLSITNAHVVYKDETMDFFTSISGLNFSLSGDMTADRSILKTLTTIDSLNMEMESVQYFKNTEVEIKADIDADIANNKYTFSENEFRLNELILGLDGWLVLLEDSYDMDIKFGAKKTEFKNILSLVPAVYMTDFASIKTSGKLALDGYAKGEYTETSLPAFGLDLLIEDAMFKYPDLPKSVDNIQVNLHIDNPGGSEDNTFVNLKRFHMELAGNPIDMNMQIRTPVSDADIDGEIKMKLDLISIKDVIPLETGDEVNGQIAADVRLKGKVSALEQERYEDFTAEGQFSITNMDYKSDSLPYDVLIKKMVLNFSPQYVELADFQSKIGESDIQSNGKIENFIGYAFSDDEALKGRFNLTSKLMNLNEFMEDEEEGTVTEGEEEPLEVIEIPKNIEFVLNSSFKKVLYDNMEMKDLEGVLIVKDQKVTMKNLSMKFMGGSMVINGFYETTNPKAPGIDFDMDIKDFDVQQVGTTFNTVEKLAPVVKSCVGSFNTTLKLNGKLDETMMPDLNSLSGIGNMLTNNISVKDFKPITKLASALKNDKLKTIKLAKNTSVDYRFEDGKVIIEPFNINMGKTTGTLEGTNSLDQSIDYKMALKIPSKELGAGDALNQLNSQASGLGLDLKASEFVNINVGIGGTFTNPKIKTALKGAGGSLVDNAKEAVKEQVKEKIEDIKDDAKEKARAEADKLLKNAEVQANKIRTESKNAADAVRSEADKQAKALLKEAGGNFLKKKLAQKGGDKLKDTAEKKAKGIENEGNKKADAIMSKAKLQATKLVGE